MIKIDGGDELLKDEQKIMVKCGEHVAVFALC